MATTFYGVEYQDYEVRTDYSRCGAEFGWQRDNVRYRVFPVDGDQPVGNVYKSETAARKAAVRLSVASAQAAQAASGQQF
jgi:hypothetical protein